MHLEVKPSPVPYLCRSKHFASDELTQEDLQFLKVLIEGQIKELDEKLKLTKSFLAMLWNHCNPEDPTTREDFRVFSESRIKYLKSKRRKVKLESIQRKIKRQLSNPC